MKYFKDEANLVYAFEEDGSQDPWIADGLVSIDEDEMRVLTAPPPLTDEQKQAIIKAQISSIELNRQPRALREFVLGTDTHSLATINEEIAALRAQLTN